MKVVLLCGGAGRRMFPITEDKFLLKFLGKTLLEHQIKQATRHGLTRLVVVAGPRSIPSIEAVVAGIGGIRVEIVPQEEPAGIADALQCAAAALDDEFIVLNPNDVFDGHAYAQLLEARRDNRATAYVLGCRVSDYFPGGYLETDQDSRLTHIVEKPARGSEPSDLVNILAHLHTDPERLLRHIAATVSADDDVYERALDAMAVADRSIRVVPYAGRWTPIKYPWHILAAAGQLLDASTRRIAPSAVISDRAVVEGDVVIGDNARVLENAVVRGPVYIGPNSVIGNGSLVRDHSHIGADCVVGFATEVKGSYIGDRSWLHMCYVGDSVVGEGCSFGAGTVFANWRFDERTIRVRVGEDLVDSGLDKLGAIVGNNCRTGVNASLMPGVKVGPDAIVGAQTCLLDDLPPDCMALTGAGQRVVANRFGSGQPTAAKRMGEVTG